MKPKLIPIILFCVLAGQLKAQTLNNIFEDVKKIKGLVSLPKNGPLTIADKDTAAWDAIVKKYIPIENQKTPAAILTYVKNNPFITASGLFASESKKDTSKGGEEEMLISHKYTDFEAL